MVLSPSLNHSHEFTHHHRSRSFEVAVSLSRTLCCGKLFCLKHISEWLNGTDSDYRCPSCRMPCTGILSLALPVLKSPPPTPRNDALSTSNRNPSWPQLKTPGDQSPQTDSPEAKDLKQAYSLGNTRTITGAVTKLDREGKHPLSKERAMSSYPSSDEEVERRKDVSLNTFYRRTSKPSRHHSTIKSHSKVSPSLSPCNSILISARRPQEVIAAQLPLAGHELAVSSARLCEVAARTVGRLLSVVGLVMLFWILLT
ncbi:hypothetical protein E1B28_011425 [Marasmius oreades]|uniref:Uncharacterized protein n=1 Tax=Marasmius oreades TaxID=181124 RepID=A0A9P7RU15_9AGAR|nr:uncharacterized protein E1B28_011425 [Marasmius oreades]KAG7089771.1 hypothetical protein E1B28_011425 [Marasmius oreades]